MDLTSNNPDTNDNRRCKNPYTTTRRKVRNRLNGWILYANGIAAMDIRKNMTIERLKTEIDRFQITNHRKPRVSELSRETLLYAYGNMFYKEDIMKKFGLKE